MNELKAIFRDAIRFMAALLMMIVWFATWGVPLLWARNYINANFHGVIANWAMHILHSICSAIVLLLGAVICGIAYVAWSKRRSYMPVRAVILNTCSPVLLLCHLPCFIWSFIRRRHK